MLEYKGQYNSAIVYNDEVEETAISQIYSFLNHPAFAKGRIRIMSDIHAGAGAVIGFTSELNPDMIIPNVIGVDIGCGVLTYRLPCEVKEVDFERFDKHVRLEIPSGTSTRSCLYLESPRLYKILNENEIKDYDHFKSEVDRIIHDIGAGEYSTRFWNSIGSLGSGNHFLELNRDEFDEIWITIHSGSRNFGLQIANFHQKKAIAKLGKMGGLEYLEGEDAQYYIRDMKIAQIYARLNRLVMLQLLIEYFDLTYNEKMFKVESIHNYINFKDNIIRKGAISAHKDENVVIPFNMATGCIIGTGKGNIEWNYSAPHGAGRTMSRSKAKEVLDLEEFELRMKEADVWSSCISKGTIDESPMSYKEPESILGYIKDTIHISRTIKPIYNFKATE